MLVLLQIITICDMECNLIIYFYQYQRLSVDIGTYLPVNDTARRTDLLQAVELELVHVLYVPIAYIM